MRGAALGELVERARPALRVDAAAAMVEPARELLGEQPGALVVGDVGRRPLRRQPVEVDEVADAVRHRLGELHHQAAALRVADDRDGAGAGVSSTASASRTSASQRVEGGVVGVAVAPLVPRHDPPARRRRAAARTGRRSPAKSMPPWQSTRAARRRRPTRRWRSHAVSVDPPAAIGSASAGIGEGLLGCAVTRPRLTVLRRGLIGLVG